MEAGQHLQKHVHMLLGRLFELTFTVDVVIDVLASHASASGLSLHLQNIPLPLDLLAYGSPVVLGGE
jgi:hypothetical protein